MIRAAEGEAEDSRFMAGIDRSVNWNWLGVGNVRRVYREMWKGEFSQLRRVLSVSVIYD
jgi:hypothetical protein